VQYIRLAMQIRFGFVGTFN